MKKQLPILKKVIVLGLMILFTCIHLQATNYFVSNSGNDANNGLTNSSAFATIETAVNTAIDGDIITVDTGTYEIANAITIDNKSIVLQAIDKGFKTILNCNDFAGLFIISSSAGINNSVIKGFKINMVNDGTAFAIYNASVPQIIGNYISYGTGIYCLGSEVPYIERNFFIGQNIAVTLNTFTMPVQIKNNTFDNTLYCIDGGISDMGNVNIVNNIFLNATYAMAFVVGVTTTVLNNCYSGIANTYSYFSDTSNIQTADPMINFIDYSLIDGSPCINKGQGPLDPDGSPAEIGASYYITQAAQPNANIMFDYNMASCANVTWDQLLKNNTDPQFFTASYTHLWVLDGDTINAFNPPSTSVGIGQHNWQYIIRNSGNQQMLDMRSGNFGINKALIHSSVGSQACLNDIVEFRLNANNYNNLQWNYGDGSPTQMIDMYNMNDPMGKHSYSIPGTYSVKAYWMSMSCGGSDSAVLNITVSSSATSKPEIVFENNGYQCPFSNINLSSTGNYISYKWIFPTDTLYGKKVSHVFDVAGDYPVKLEVINACGKTGVSTDTIHIADNLPAYAEFGYDIQNNITCQTQPMFFKAYSQDSYSYNWDFGDGQFGYDKELTHVYDSAGMYTVTLVTYNNCGNTATVQKPIYVNPGSVGRLGVYMQPELNYYYGNSPPSTLNVCPGSNVFFSNKTDRWQPLTFEWFVNNEYQSANENDFSFYRYDTATYTIKLMAHNECNIYDSATYTIIVTDTIKPSVWLGAFPKKVAKGDTVLFYDRNYSKENSYYIEYGNGNYDYPNDIKGYYQVLAQTTYNQDAVFTFTATNQCNNSITLSDSIKVINDVSEPTVYYIQNSTMAGDQEPADISKRIYATDMEVTVNVKMDSWIEGMDSSIFLFYFMDKVDTNKNGNGPRGFASFKVNNSITTGQQVKVYIPYETDYKTFGLAAGAYCDSRSIEGMPQSFAMAGNVESINYIYSGSITLNADIPPIICQSGYYFGGWESNDSLGNHRSLRLESNMNFRLDLYGSNSNNSADGTYTVLNDSTYNFNSYCGNITATVKRIADTLYFYNVIDYSVGYCKDLVNSFNNTKYVISISNLNKANPSCAGDPVSFHILGGEFFEWHFGDAKTSKEQNPMHIYNSDGTYDAFVIATNTLGRIDTIHTSVIIGKGEKINAKINMNNSQIIAGEAFSISAKDGYQRFFPYKVKWYLDGMLYSTAPDTMLTLFDGNQHFLSLVVYNGCDSATNYQSIRAQTVNVLANFNIKKLNEFDYQFEAIEKGAKEYYWDFGDGIISDTTVALVKHTYAKAGSYTVGLTAYDVNYYSNYSYRNLYVKGICNAGFSVTKVDQITESVDIKNNATNADIITWNFHPYWLYDTIDNRALFTHTYDAPGKYDITQYVEDSKSGCLDTAVVTVLLRDTSCRHWFYYTSLPNKVADFEAFSYNELDTVKKWTWDFGDGQAATGKYVKHAYAKVGYYNVTLKAEGTFCKSSYESYGYAEGLACDTPFFTKAVSGSTYTFSLINPKDGILYDWNMGDGSNNIQGNSVTYNYTTDGIYWPYVYAYDTINNCSEYQSDSVRIGNVGCWAYFSYTNDSATRVQFYNYSSSEAQYMWDFGDGTSSRAFETSHLYKNAGIYKVSLTVNDTANHCMKQETVEIAAGKVECKADFSFTVDGTGKATFKNLSTGMPTDYYWYFGDWNYSSEANPTNEYTENGIYNVYLSVYNNISGCVDEIYKEVLVGNLTDMTKASFSYYLSDDNQTVYFTNESSDNVTSTYWTFGDGTYVSDANPTKKYSKPGIYRVCLKVFNKTTGESAEQCNDIMIGEAPCNLKSEFSYMLDNKTNTVKLANRSSGDIDAYYWDFGDETTSDLKTPSHQYKTPGFYLITLSVRKWNSDCADFFADFVQVGEANCRAAFEYSVDASNNTVTLVQKAAGDVADYYWYYDDGNYSTEKNPVKKFDYPGIHYVSLTVNDAFGLCSDNTEQQIQVGTVDCSAKFSYYVDIKTRKAFCKNEAMGDATEYFWSFGDGSQSEQANPTHEFKYPGYYTIGLNTFNGNTWCMDYFEQSVLIGDPGIDCEADFFFAPNDANREVKFTDKSKGTISTYVWNFGDGRDSVKTTNSPKPFTHKYNVGGIYNVCLSVINENDVPNMTCKDVKIAVTDATNCTANFAYTVDTLSKTVSLVNKSLGDANKLMWNYGDKMADTTTSDTIRHKYNAADFYLVSLKIETAKGCKSSNYQLINVSKQNDSIRVSFGYDINEYSKKAGGYPVDLVGAGMGDQAKLRWSFGDGTPDDSTSNTPTHTYVHAQGYKVCLTLSDPVSNQSATHCDSVTLEELCAADQIKPVAHCKDTIIEIGQLGFATVLANELNNGSVDDCGIQLYSSNRSVFDTPGEFQVQFVVTDYHNNTDTCYAKVTVNKGSYISNNEFATNFNAYPNPFNEKLSISYYLLRNENVEISLYDMLGKKVSHLIVESQKAGIQNITYNTSNIANGSYILQLKSAGGLVKRQAIVKK